MRRHDRALEHKEILDIIQECHVFRIAMVDGGKPYVIPLNFGYTDCGNELTFYFHCAKEGRKLDILRSNPEVCFEMDTRHQLTEGEVPCMYGYLYASVIGEGIVTVLENHDEKAAALTALMLHQAGKEFSFTPAQTAHVTVCKITVTSISGKARKI